MDYNHPDLKANMWVNPGEIPGNGIDDDGDGYIDDVYGCSTVSDARFHSGDPMDDHGHGTHVAGIIAASNNKTGIVGVAYNAKIMAIKAGQATGVFLQSDIVDEKRETYITCPYCKEVVEQNIRLSKCEEIWTTKIEDTQEEQLR